MQKHIPEKKNSTPYNWSKPHLFKDKTYAMVIFPQLINNAYWVICVVLVFLQIRMAFLTTKKLSKVLSDNAKITFQSKLC